MLLLSSKGGGDKSSRKLLFSKNVHIRACIFAYLSIFIKYFEPRRVLRVGGRGWFASDAIYPNYKTFACHLSNCVCSKKKKSCLHTKSATHTHVKVAEESIYSFFFHNTCEIFFPFVFIFIFFYLVIFFMVVCTKSAHIR